MREVNSCRTPGAPTRCLLHLAASHSGARLAMAQSIARKHMLVRMRTVRANALATKCMRRTVAKEAAHLDQGQAD